MDTAQLERLGDRSRSRLHPAADRSPELLFICGRDQLGQQPGRCGEGANRVPELARGQAGLDGQRLRAAMTRRDRIDCISSLPLA